MSTKIAIFSFIIAIFSGSHAVSGDFTIDDDESRLIVADGGKPIFAFVYKRPESGAPSAADAPFVPSHYIHPLFGLLGESTTGDTASDRDGAPGIHWSWAGLGIQSTLINIEAGEGGRREFERILGAEFRGDEAIFAVQNAWITDADGQAKVMENLTFTTYALADNQRTIDVDVLIRNVSDYTLFLQGALPGAGLSLVLDPQRSDWAFSSSSGWVQPASPPYMSPWTVATYRDDRRSTRSGIAIMQDSRNPGYSGPSWLIENGPRLTAGTGRDFKLELKPAGFLEFRYRIILFRAVGGGPDMTAEYSKFMGLVQDSN